MESSEFLVLIPARYHSSRFPGKPLASFGGKAVIHHLWDNLCRGQGALDNVYIVTDDARIQSAVGDFGGKVLRMDQKAQTGSDRVHLCYETFFKDRRVDFILNVQGDGPLLRAQDIRALVAFHSRESFDITTLVKRETDTGEFHNPNRVKVAYTRETGKCHYFSRAPLPSPLGHIHHLGVYCFRPQALEAVGQMSPSPLEKTEGLEQLRALEAGMSIGALEVSIPWVSIDGPEDIERAQALLEGGGS